MNLSRNAVAAATLAASVLFSLPAFAVAPMEPASPPGRIIARASLPTDYKLDTEVIVNNWVLCISRSFAEQLADARRMGPDAALETYNTLKSTKSCGRFTRMRVILREPVYGGVASDAGGDATVFQADVDLSGKWASAYVVSGSLPSR